ncbi:ATP-binding cassette sub-family A member 3, partial [Stegodyphus mimosarum]
MKMVETSGIRQCLILLYKGLLFRKRHYIVTFFEIVVPVLLMSVPAIIQSESNARYPYRRSDYDEPSEYRANWIDPKFYPPFDPFEKGTYGRDVQFVFAPSNGITENLMNASIELWKEKTKYIPRNIGMKGVADEDEMEAYCRYIQRSDNYLTIIGTVFNNFVSKKELPASLDYKIRYGEQYQRSFYTTSKYRVNGPSYGTDYEQTFFLGWQTAVEETFIKQKMEGEKMEYKLLMQEFPYPRHRENKGAMSIYQAIPWFVGYSLLIFIIDIIRRIIEEKANGSKELLKMM